MSLPQTKPCSDAHTVLRLRFTVYKDADLFDFINAPVGKGLPVTEKLRPLIAGLSAHLPACEAG